MKTESYTCMSEKVDFEEFCWKRVPVVAGNFTLNEALSKEAKEHIQIDIDLNQTLSYFQYVPCVKVYTLQFSDSVMFIRMNTNQAETISLKNMETLQCQDFDYYGDELTIRVRRIKRYEGFSLLDRDVIKKTTINNKSFIKKIMCIPQELLDGIRVKLDNNDIADKDGNIIMLENTTDTDYYDV